MEKCTFNSQWLKDEQFLRSLASTNDSNEANKTFKLAVHCTSKMSAVLVLLMVGLVSGSIVCPDGTECEDKNTCCPTETGYSCCQYPSAVCCPDKAHCCPQGYQCDLETQLCEKKGLPWYRIPLSPQISSEDEEKRAPAPLVKSDNPSVSVVHCDNIYTCPDGTTCCRSPFGQWSCCIYSVGQCCPDGIHCCPFGYFCDSTSTHCFRGALRFPASPQIAAMHRNTIQDQCCQSETGCCPIGFHCDEEVCISDFDKTA
ncbi:hypothetical protein AMELA_G00248020 [Ameiurus melas]|uniref:Granulins domain-containing protein n=1 Tax=Ameiurus melas TaxID=219545 RepID=A0A7J5ZV89_AMEME|nr:hypothetical protein AMELA_G00248020 [Ameiurus melas]